MPQQQLTLRIQVILYLMAAGAISILLIDQYRQGLYSLVLSNAIAIPAFLFSSVYLVYQSRPIPFVMGASSVHSFISWFISVSVKSLPDSDEPLFIRHAIVQLLLFTDAERYPDQYFSGTSQPPSMLWHEFGWQNGLRYGINYGLLLGSAWCFAYLTQLKQLSLKRLALTDQISGAYNKRHFLPYIGARDQPQ